MLRLGEPAVHLKVSDARRKKMLLRAVFIVPCTVKRNRVIPLRLREDGFSRLRCQVFRNKYVNGGKQHRKDKQHRAKHGKGYISSYMLHFEPPSDRSR